MRYLLLFILAPFLSVAQKQTFQLHGTLSLSRPVSWVYLRYYPALDMVVDSVQPKNGAFSFEGPLAEPVAASLSVSFQSAAGEPTAKSDPVMLFLEPGIIQLVAKDSLNEPLITGSKANDEFKKLKALEKPFDERQKPLVDAYLKARSQGDQASMNQLEKQLTALDQEAREQVYKAYVEAHPQSPIALFALRQYAGYDLDADKVAPLFDKLPATVQKWPSALIFRQEIDIARKTAIGHYAVDFTQNDTAGHPLSLSSLKGKYVLVDFWASWCRPCRMENPNVVKAFSNFKDKNFTIISVSLDKPGDREKWLKAIHDDKLAWNHVSDLKFWNNAVAKLYGIRAIPQNLLLDPQGKIIAKNLRGEELDGKLKEVMGTN